MMLPPYVYVHYYADAIVHAMRGMHTGAGHATCLLLREVTYYYALRCRFQRHFAYFAILRC